MSHIVSRIQKNLRIHSRPHNVFKHNHPRTTMLYAIEYARVLLDSGKGKETVIAQLAEQHFPQISPVARSTLKQIKKGYSLNDALTRAGQRHPEMVQEFLAAFKTGNPQLVLADVSQRLIQEQQRTAENQIEKLNGSMQKAVFIMALPLSLFMLLIIQDALAIEFIASPQLEYALFAVSIVLLTIVMTRMSA